MAAARKLARRPARRPLTAAQILRATRFPAVRAAISKGFGRTPPIEVTIPEKGRYVRFSLEKKQAFHPALYATISIGRRGTLGVIGTQRREVKKPRELASQLKRFGHKLKTGERRGFIYQLRKAGIIGGSRLQAILVPRERVNAAVARYIRRPEVARAVGANPWYVTDQFGYAVGPVYGSQGAAERAIERMKVRRHSASDLKRGEFVGQNESYLEGAGLVERARRRVRPNPILATLGIGGNPGVSEAERRLIVAESVTLDGEPAKVSGVKLPFAKVRSLVSPREGEWSWEGARRIVALGGRFRLNPRTRRATAARRNALHDTSDGCPKGKVRSRTGKCVKPIGYRAKRGKLYGWRKDLPAARRHQILAGAVRKDSYAAIIRRLNFLRNISGDQATRRAALADMQWLRANRARLRRVAANPRATRSRTNPQAEITPIRIPFRNGKQVTPNAVRRWLASLPNSPVKRTLTARFEQNMRQYRRFHLGAEPRHFTYKAVPMGAQRNVTDVDFVTSEGKEWAAPYQVPPHSNKYHGDTSGRYLHSHGESGIDVNIKRPAKRSRLPERFHTADGKFVGVIPSSNVSISDWYRG